MNVVLQSAEAERHEPLLTELLAHVSAYNPNPDGELIGRAFDYACEHHKGQRRNSGEDFIHHPWSVAVICSDLKLDSATIAAALLHDVVEDTEADADGVREEFGDEVALLVEGVTKLSRINFASREQAQVENYRKMIMAMAQDLRVDPDQARRPPAQHAHDRGLAKQKQVQKAKETLEIYAPLAHRLGIHSIKWELEDLAFQTLLPAPLRRDRVDGQPAPRRPRALRRRGGHDPRARSSRCSASRPTSPAAPSTSTRSTPRWPRAARSSTRSTT